MIEGLCYNMSQAIIKYIFLDLNIQVEDGQLITTKYFKETDRNVYIPRSNCQYPSALRKLGYKRNI